MVGYQLIQKRPPINKENSKEDKRTDNYLGIGWEGFGTPLGLWGGL